MPHVIGCVGWQNLVKSFFFKHLVIFLKVAEHKQPQQAVPLGMGGEGSDLGREDPRVSSVLERLSQLEGRVGNQLDQLLQLQQQQVSALIRLMSFAA